MTEVWVQTTRGRGQPPRWYSPTLWQTMTISAWLSLLRSQDSHLGSDKLLGAAASTAMTAGNSVLGLAQSALFGRRIRSATIEPDPVFILGHWRTGTTHLHNLLALDPRLSFPNTYECSAPHHCLLTDRWYPRLFSRLLPTKRAMDDMEMGFGRPQEDELALVALGVPSPYWSLGFPEDRTGRRYLTLAAVTDEERERWEKAFRGFLRLLSFEVSAAHGAARAARAHVSPSAVSASRA